MNFEPMIDNVIKIEGDYSNDANDRGGATKYGITETVARANGYVGDMKDMPISLARTIFMNRYVIVPSFHRVANVSEAIGRELVDTGINMGPGRAAEFLQRWLNGFSDGVHYQELFVDGRIGDGSIGALRAFLDWRGAKGETVMVEALNSLQGTQYLDIAERDHSQRKFLYGWVANRVAVAA